MQQFNKVIHASPKIEQTLEPVRKKEFTEALPHYAELIERNQKQYRDRLKRADERNILIFNDSFKAPIKTKTLAEQEREGILNNMISANMNRRVAI